jgi:hypothetical protein
MRPLVSASLLVGQEATDVHARPTSELHAVTRGGRAAIRPEIGLILNDSFAIRFETLSFPKGRPEIGC